MEKLYASYKHAVFALKKGNETVDFVWGNHLAHAYLLQEQVDKVIDEYIQWCMTNLKKEEMEDEMKQSKEQCILQLKKQKGNENLLEEVPYTEFTLPDSSMLWKAKIKRSWIDFFQMMELLKYQQFDTSIKQALQYIEKHFKENISLQDVADYLEISVSHLSRLLKQNQVGV